MLKPQQKPGADALLRRESRRARRIAFIFAAGLMALLGACGDDEAPAGPPVQISAEDQYKVESRTIPDLKTVAATVTTRDMADARARIGGTLSRLAVKEGDEVKKGQLVAMIVDQRLTFETSAVDAQVAAAAAEAARAQAEFDRVKVLYEKGVYAKARFDQAEAAARGAAGVLKAAEAQRDARTEVAAQGAVLAPTAGKVLHAQVPAGSVVAPGQTVATITAGPPLLRAEIPEGQARTLRVGDPVSIVPEDLPDTAAGGEISEIFPAVTAGRIVVDITVPDLKAERVGQRVRVHVKVGEREALIVPEDLVQTRHGIDFVRLLLPEGPVDIPVQVTYGPSSSDKEILSGLKPGDVIVREEAKP